MVGGDAVVLHSADARGVASVPIDVEDPAAVEPSWARYVAGVVAETHPAAGLRGQVSTTLPVGAGLSSSAALELAVALALGFEGTPLELALTCQRAEQRASGVPSGVMDQLASAAGVDGHALLIDCTSLTVTPVPVPDEVEVVVVHSGEERALAGSAYGERRATCEAATAVIGPLREARLTDLSRIADPVVRRRARHVLTENARVLEMVEALAAGDHRAAGALLSASHASLATDFDVSTPGLDALVARLTALPGVHGARLTGAGFGGCVVALGERGALGGEGWHVRPGDGARVTTTG
jgi:galactokinase